jgi:hypothetical protein
MLEVTFQLYSIAWPTFYSANIFHVTSDNIALCSKLHLLSGAKVAFCNITLRHISPPHPWLCYYTVFYKIYIYQIIYLPEKLPRSSL